jgi:Mg-chelatase subunit ChlD
VELRSIRRGRRGQMRVVEALLSCFVIVLGFTISAYFSNSYLGVRRGEMEVTSINVAGLLGSQSLLEKVLENKTSSWEQDLKSCLESLLPANTFYALKIHSEMQGKDIAYVSNVYGENITAGMNTASAWRVITVTLPMVRNETKQLDAMLILDRSGSMDWKADPDDPHNKIWYLKNASNYFVDCLNMSTARVGMASFSTTASLDRHFTNDSTAIKQAINGLVADGWTDMGDAIKLAVQEFNQSGRDESSWAAILISDGVANRPEDPQGGGNETKNEIYAQRYAKEQADELSLLGVSIYTIGLGDKSYFNETLLKQIGSAGYYYSPSAQQLDEIYELIISDIMYRIRFDIVVLELTVMRPGEFD